MEHTALLPRHSYKHERLIGIPDRNELKTRIPGQAPDNPKRFLHNGSQQFLNRRARLQQPMARLPHKKIPQHQHRLHSLHPKPPHQLTLGDPKHKHPILGQNSKIKGSPTQKFPIFDPKPDTHLGIPLIIAKKIRGQLSP